MITQKTIISRLTVLLWIELVLALTLLGGLIAANIYREHARIEANEQERLVTQAQIISKNLAFQLQGANHALLAIIQEIPKWKNDPEGAIKRLKIMADTMPGIGGFDVFDASGRLIYSSFPEYIGKPFNYRDYFITAKKIHDPARLYVSAPFRGVSGTYLLNLSRIVPDAHGEFAGLVTAMLDPEYFQPLLASVRYTTDTRSALVHSSGALFISEPDTDTQRGMNLAVPGSLFTKHKQSGKEVTVFSGPLYDDHRPQMVAQTTLATQQLQLHDTLLVSVSRDQMLVFKYWSDNAMIQVICYVIFAAFSIYTLYIFQRREAKYAALAAETSHALYQSEKLFRSTYDSAAIGMALLDTHGRFMQANRALCQSVGYDEAELCQQTIQDITHPDDQRSDQALLMALRSSERDNYQIEKRFFHKHGHTLWALLTYSSLKDEAGNLLHFVVQIQDITQYKSLQETLHTQANHDFLTGLPNRRHFMARAATELARLNRRGGSLAILIIDIDHFKKINDNYGHLGGDIVLQQFGQRCKAQLREIDLLCRYGGEEFAVLLPDTHLDQALEVAERLRAAASRDEIILPDQPHILLTISIGLTIANAKHRPLEKLLAQTDAALYQAKQTGRNKVCVSLPDAE